MGYLIKKIFVPVVFLIDFIGSVLFFWMKMRNAPKKINKALFVRLEHIGDMVLATPVFETFKKNNPKVEVTVLCRELTVPIIENNPYVDKIITYEAPWFINRGGKKRSLWSLGNELRAKKFDIVFEMHGDPRNNLLVFLTDAYSIGYGCRGGGFFLNKIMGYDKNKYIILQNLSLIKNFSKKQYQNTKIFITKRQEKEAMKIMRKYGLEKGDFIIISPRSGREEKDLTDSETENFINKNKGTKIIIAGSKSEASKNKRFRKFDNVIDMTGETDLPTLICLVKNSKKVIAPDTGIIHIAKALDKKFTTIYKTTDPKIWGYRN
jgi:ADP-heptose:LPS heptosyltransferase